MRHRPETTETGWALAKGAVLVAVLVTLATFTVSSHLFSQARAGRIGCLDNQRATALALLYYQAENGGGGPPTLEALRSFSPDSSRSLGRCPADVGTKYFYDPASGRVICPNADHRAGS